MDYYFCADSQNVEGPVSAAELSELRARGRVVADTQVMRVGTDEWRSYESEFASPVEPFDAAALFEPAPALGDPVAPPPLWQPAPLPQPVPQPPRKPARSGKRADPPAEPPLVSSAPSSPVSAFTLPTVPGSSAAQPSSTSTAKSSGMSYKKKGCLGCLGAVALLFVLALCGRALLKKEFAEHRNEVLAQVQAADSAHDYQRVAELGDKYEFLDDPQLNRYLVTAHAALKEAKGKAEDARKAAEERAQDEKKVAAEKEKANKKAVEEKERTAKEHADKKIKASRKTGSDTGFIVGFSDKSSGRPKRSFEQIETDAKSVTQNFTSEDEKRDFIEGYEEGYYAGWDSAR